MRQFREANKEQTELLLKEAGISSYSLCQGLTALRKANFGEKGYYYQGFFLLSIGLERLLKLILIYKYRIENNDKFPDNATLKEYGHDIEKITNLVIKGYESKLLFRKDDEPYKSMIKLLSDFAKSTRYYNLDKLTGKANLNNDPLKEWYKIQEIIINKHPIRKRMTDKELELVSLMNEISYVSYTDNNENKINDLFKYFDQVYYCDHTQGYSVYYLCRIISSLVLILEDFEYEFLFFPFLREFFFCFKTEGISMTVIRKKKNWVVS